MTRWEGERQLRVVFDAGEGLRAMTGAWGWTSGGHLVGVRSSNGQVDLALLDPADVVKVESAA